MTTLAKRRDGAVEGARKGNALTGRAAVAIAAAAASPGVRCAVRNVLLFPPRRLPVGKRFDRPPSLRFRHENAGRPRGASQKV